MKLILLMFLLVACSPEVFIVEVIKDEGIQAIETEVLDPLSSELKNMVENELQNHVLTKSESSE